MNFENSTNDSEKIYADFEKLRIIANLLREMGLEVIDRFVTLESLKDPMSEYGFPIVRNGIDGIRVSYFKNEGLKVWFTNGFEDPNNNLRKEIESKLKEIL